MSSRRDERDRDRRRRDRSGSDEDRRERRRRDRSCSDDDDDARERARKERRRKKKWDVVGEGASAPTLSAAEQRTQQLATLARLQAASNPLVSLLPGMQGANKKQRELYVGNLGNQAQEAQLKTVFTQALCAFEGYDPLPGPPVVSVSLCGGGTYAFVEFRDEQASATPPGALGSRRGSR